MGDDNPHRVAARHRFLLLHAPVTRGRLGQRTGRHCRCLSPSRECQHIRNDCVVATICARLRTMIHRCRLAGRHQLCTARIRPSAWSNCAPLSRWPRPGSVGGGGRRPHPQPVLAGRCPRTGRTCVGRAPDPARASGRTHREPLRAPAGTVSIPTSCPDRRGRCAGRAGHRRPVLPETAATRRGTPLRSAHTDTPIRKGRTRRTHCWAGSSRLTRATTTLSSSRSAVGPRVRRGWRRGAAAVRRRPDVRRRARGSLGSVA